MSAARRNSALLGKRMLCAMPILALGLALPCLAQTPNPGSNQGTGTRGIRSVPPDPSDMIGLPMGDPVFQERRMRQLALETHKQMVSDTDKLLQLVTELSTEISTTNPRSFTPDQLHKIAQIEKLAHSVREKMGNTLLGAPDNMQGPPDPSIFRH